jgi:restriction system protein
VRRGPSLHGFLNAVSRDLAQSKRRAEAERRRQIRHQQRTLRETERELIYEEKERKRQYIEDRIQEASDMNDDLAERIKELESVLPKTLNIKNTVSFEALKPKDTPPVFCPPKELAKPLRTPQQEDFLATVKKPNWLTGMFSTVKQTYSQNLQRAEKDYATALESHGHADEKRQSELRTLEKQHGDDVARFLAKIEAKNKEIEDFKKAYLEGDEDAITQYCTLLFDYSEYPEDFPQQFRILYRSESKQLVIEYELPTVNIVPIIQEYRYVKSKDAIEEKSRKVSEIRSIYQDIVSSVTLKTLHEVFEADQGNRIDVVIFNGYVNAIDPATGKSIRPCLISLRTTKERFMDISLDHVDKKACLRNLGAQVSPQPSELVAVKPVIEFNMVDRRFVDQADILSGMDGRLNIMDLNPFEFENFVSNLFEKMGLESKLTRSSRDGGVDAIAYDTRPILGGKVVIQAKRYKNVVGVSAVRDLYGTMMNEGANKGILVTTSNYGPDAYEFAKDKPIELIDGGGLLYLLDQVGVSAKIILPDD